MSAISRRKWHVFIRPGALSGADLEQCKEAIDKSATECGIAFQYETSTQGLDSLLVHVRSCSSEDFVRDLLFLICEKSEVLVVECFRAPETQGLPQRSMLTPSAAESRSFMCESWLVPWVAWNLDVCNLEWEDFADNLDESGIYRG